MDEKALEAAKTEAATDTAAPDSAPAGESLESLLAEFEQSTAKPEGTDAPATDTPPDANGTDALTSLQRQFDGFREQTMLRDLQAQEDADAATVIGQAKEAVAGYPVPDDYAEAYLLRAYQLDANLQEAWDHRYDSDAARDRCERAVRHAIGKLVDSAKSMPDPEATADTLAVVHAVRGTSTKAPEERPPDYSRMTNEEFGREQEKLIGFRTV